MVEQLEPENHIAIAAIVFLLGGISEPGWNAELNPPLRLFVDFVHIFVGRPLDKSEGVVKTEISWAVREHRLLCQRRLRTKTLEISPESLCGGVVPPT